jgi:hypothetical protein
MALNRETAYSRALPLMARKSLLAGGAEPLSRKRTADMIRQLRALTQELKMLRARLEAEEKVERQRPILTSHRKRQAD